MLLETVLLAGAVVGQAIRPSIADVGSSRILFQNDLSRNYTASSILMRGSVANADAASQCQAFGENVLSKVDYNTIAQLQYLVFSGELENSTQLWVSNNATVNSTVTATAAQSPESSTVPAKFKRQSSNSSCMAYTLSSKSIESVNCETSLAVLCTQSALPFDAGYGQFEGTNTQSATYQVDVSVGNDSATMTGFRDGRSFRFLGIPFAQPPVGDLRFAPAQALQSVSNTSALQYGAQCYQAPSNFGVTANLSEDCLNLNIYTPYLPGVRDTRRLPVAVWIYGGAFVEGANSVSAYDGGDFASRGDIVVVSLNYRLGALGFLASQTMLNGSQGITDQIEAIRWVNNYIDAFGGNSSDITIFGESAGAQSVVALLSSSPASGLFKAALAQSAPVGIPWVTRQVYVDMLPTLANATNCNTSSESELVSCLRNLDPSVFVTDNFTTASNTAAAIGQGPFDNATAVLAAIEPYLPTVGTGVIDGQFNDLLQSGALPNKVPLMIGNMENEGTGFVYGAIPDLPASQDVFNFILTQALDNRTVSAIVNNPTLFAVNTSDPNALLKSVSQVLTLFQWQCPLQQLITSAFNQRTFPSLYNYRFSQGIWSPNLPFVCNPESAVDAVCHSSDIIATFGTANVLGLTFNASNPLSFSQYINDVWSSFIRTTDPNPSTEYLEARGPDYAYTLSVVQSHPFQTFDPSSATVMDFDNSPNSSTIFFPQQCQVLAQAGFLYDRVQNSTSTTS